MTWAKLAALAEGAAIASPRLGAGTTAGHEPCDDRLRAAYEAGLAAAERGEEAAPGCTATPEGHAFLDGYIEGRRRAPAAARAT